jgi:TIR domain-containing protein
VDGGRDSPASSEGAPLSEIDPRAPVFFLSYSRGQNSEIVPYVVKLFDDLVGWLSVLVARRPGEDYGFIDKSMRGGEVWESQLADAVGKCQVFVALIGVPYFNSVWCGREWYAFTRRTVTKRRDTTRISSAIVPVIWAPDLSGVRHAEVEKVQRFSPGPAYESLYLERGIFGLMRSRRTDEYEEIVWRLANWIAETFYTFRVDPLVVEARDLRNPFHEGQP